MAGNKICIRGRWIGRGEPCFITVDIGPNHNRDLKIAKRLIDKAAEAKVDAIKFQVFSAEDLYSKYVPQHSHYKKHLWKMVKEIEMPRSWIPILKSYCDKRGIMFFATPFDMEAVDQLDLYVDFFKVASFELVDLPLIRHIAKKKKPMIMSTGLATMKEINEAYLSCIKSGNSKIIFLQCASVYPAMPEIMNLSAMQTIRKAFGVNVGLSDHTLGTHISIAAVAMGACVIEKHFTLNRAMQGPDHHFAIEPEEIKEMVSQIRDVESALGTGKKSRPNLSELENYRIGRRSIHAKVDIPKGAKIREDMLIVKRPGLGIKPKFMDRIVGKKAKKRIRADEWITWKVI